MSTSLSLKSASTAVVLLLAGAATASAADNRFCEDYAHAAIIQVRGGLNNPRCVPGMQGPRWSAEWRVHYDWCRAASYAAVGAERDARTNYLRGCR